jgi:propanol-preferring alcohol dehydrogenase
MHAFRLTAPHTTELTTVPQPEPKAGEVLVRVGAAGVCHSDLHIIDAPDALGMPIPLTLGHENAGWIEALGPGVTSLERGESVAVYGIVGCGTCVACLAGRDNECRRTAPGGIGLSRDGGMAEYVVVPARQLIPIGDLDIAQAAPLTDAGLTPYHAINITRHNLRPSSTCVVIGVGGLGHMAVQILAAITASRIIAVDVREEALRLAREVGAREVLRSDDKTASNIASSSDHHRVVRTSCWISSAPLPQWTSRAPWSRPVATWRSLDSLVVRFRSVLERYRSRRA